jgi:formamidopyrimidine-DNA glycosylase
VPELPEVETTIRDLRPKVVGRSFKWVELSIPRMVRFPSPDAFKAGLIGRTITAAERRGKFLLFPLDHGAFVVHLMMGGALLRMDFKREVLAAAEPTTTWMGRQPGKYTRLRFGLDDESELWLVNPRTLGGVWLVDDPAQVVGHLGPEPLDPSFTASKLADRLKGRSAPIKPLLLSQEVVAGIGNIYADESLFLAGIRPERPADELTLAEVKRLHASIVTALNKGVELRGTSLDDFVNPDGTEGAHQTQLNVFRRGGLPCPKCGTPVTRTFFRGRGTHFCPKCQK